MAFLCFLARWVGILTRVGLTGGIASGKSTVARMLVSKGAHLLDADQVARKIVEPGEPAWAEIVSWLGGSVLRDDRTLNRAQIASLVFSNSRALQRLNSITHPHIKKYFTLKSKEIALNFPRAIQIWDVPLLFEIGMDRDVDIVLVVVADEERQIIRLGERDGLSRDEAKRRIASQMDLQKKARSADYIISNDGSLDYLQDQVDRLWIKLTKG
jgi:dephospho-CoA kinase